MKVFGLKSKDTYLASSPFQSCCTEELKKVGIPFSSLLHRQMNLCLEQLSTVILFFQIKLRADMGSRNLHNGTMTVNGKYQFSKEKEYFQSC